MVSGLVSNNYVISLSYVIVSDNIDVSNKLCMSFVYLSLGLELKSCGDLLDSNTPTLIIVKIEQTTTSFITIMYIEMVENNQTSVCR